MYVMIVAEIREALRLYFLPVTALARLAWVLAKGARHVEIRGYW
jgi:hypothetical protein